MGNFFVVGDSLLQISTTLHESLNELKVLTLNFSSASDLSIHLESNFFLAYEPGVVLCDLDVSHRDSLTLVSNYNVAHPEGFINFVFVGSQIKSEMAVDLMKTGSIDVMSKPINEKKLTQEIKTAFSLSLKKKAQVIQTLMNLGRINQLTSKEIAILVQILEGYTNRQIAEKLGNSSRTVEIHRASIFDKLDVKNAIELCLKLST